MEFNVTYNKEYNYLIAEVMGDMVNESLMGFGEEMMKMAKTHDCSRVLSDLRKANIKLSVLKLHEIPNTLNKKGFLNIISKRAVLIKEMTSDMKFYETTSVNQFSRIKVFTDYDEALTWLLYPEVR